MEQRNKAVYVYKDLSNIIENNASRKDIGVTFIEDQNHTKFVSNYQIFQNAKTILYGLQKNGLKKGTKLIFQLKQNEAFVNMLWACFWGGIIPVPVPVGISSEDNQKILRIWSMLGEAYIASDIDLRGQEIFRNMRKKILQFQRIF